MYWEKQFPLGKWHEPIKNSAQITAHIPLSDDIYF